MADNNRPKKNITGSYPGVTGAYNPQRKQPREFTTPDTAAPVRPRYDFDKADVKKQQSDAATSYFKPADAGEGTRESDISGTRVDINITDSKKDKAAAYGTTIFNKASVTEPEADEKPRKTTRKVKKSKTAEKSTEQSAPAGGFNFKEWFSSENVKRYLVQVRFYGIVVLLSLLFTFAIVNVANDVFAFIKPDESIIVNIPQGSDTMTIAKTLKKEGVIDHPYIFRVYSKLKRADGSYQYGDYTLNSNLGYDQIISKLKKTSVQAEAVTFTIPAGSSQDEIVDLLTSKEYFDVTELNHALNEYEYEDHPWVQELPERRCRLEGYLVPGDYQMSVGESAVTVVGRILTNFEQTVLTEANVALITASGYTTDDIVTVASLVQEECGSAAMYSGAAAVIFNRLKSEVPMYLQLTSPINYVLSEPKAQLTSDDKRTESEYNTYLYTGLPAGPVCTPSAEAIAAVLAPEQSVNMYFISDGETAYFAATAEEHAANLAKASATAKGTDTIR